MADLENTEVVERHEGTAIPGEGAPQQQSNEAYADPSQDVEQRARAMGWRPKEEFKGPEDKWRPADEFVKRGEEEMPVLRERLRDTTRKLTDIESRLARTQAEAADKLERLERVTALALHKQRQQIEGSYEAAIRAAAENADISRYDQLRQDKHQALRGIDEQIATAYQPPKPVGQPQGQQQIPSLPEHVQRTFESWVQDNQWFRRDPLLGQVATAYSEQLDRDHPGMDVGENLKRVRAFVQQKFPEKFGITPRESGPSSVEGGSRMPSTSGPRGKGWDDLPTEARRAGETFIKQKLFKDKAEYARDYWSQS